MVKYLTFIAMAITVMGKLSHQNNFILTSWIDFTYEEVVVIVKYFIEGIPFVMNDKLKLTVEILTSLAFIGDGIMVIHFRY